MIPTLNKQDATERIMDAMKSSTGDAVNKVLRKRSLYGSTSVERRLKNKMGKMMKSKIQPKTGLEEKNA